MSNNFYNSKDVSELKSRLSPARRVFTTTVSNDHSLEETMKESLNRISDTKDGNDYEQQRSEPNSIQDDGNQ